MGIKECPECKLICSEEASKCDCGYDFQIGQDRPDERQAEKPNASFEPAYRYKYYSQVPFHRKRWFIVLCFLFFAPIAFFIAISGDIYLERNGQVYKYSEKMKTSMMMACIVLLVLAFFRVISRL